MQSPYGHPFCLISEAGMNKTVICPKPGKILGLVAINTSEDVCYLKIYDKSDVPDEELDLPQLVIPIPAAAQGAGVVVPVSGAGIIFATGISCSITGGVDPEDDTAVEAGKIVVNFVYA